MIRNIYLARLRGHYLRASELRPAVALGAIAIKERLTLDSRRDPKGSSVSDYFLPGKTEVMENMCESGHELLMTL